MKRLLGLILTLTLMLPMPVFAAGCLNWATIGTYGMGSWAGGTNMVGGQAVPSAYEDKTYNQEDWHDEYETANTDCRWTAERNIRDASAIWPQDSGRIKQFFLSEMRKCQSKFESVYRASRNSFCADGDEISGDRISVPAADSTQGADCDFGNGGSSKTSYFTHEKKDGFCTQWATYGNLRIHPYPAWHNKINSDHNTKIHNQSDWDEKHQDLIQECNSGLNTFMQNRDWYYDQVDHDQARSDEEVVRGGTAFCETYYNERYKQISSGKFCKDIAEHMVLW